MPIDLLLNVKAKLYPLTFHPLFKERVWGGRNLERLYRKALPAGTVIGESWEVSDRPGDESVVRGGPLGGVSIRQLIADYGEDLMGTAALWEGRFPLLVKILDAQEKLSLQVHPPEAVATELNGDPKTEMWYMADCQDDADLYVGLRRGMTREVFEEKTRFGGVADCFHRVPVKTGDAMFLPSGRVHAIGRGNVIFEIQQNSDTTYRVHDWDRVGLDGKPRELHVDSSLKSIDFGDFEPSLVTRDFEETGDGVVARTLADCPLFRVEQCQILTGKSWSTAGCNVAVVVGGIRGELACRGGGVSIELSAGKFCLIPASVPTEIEAKSGPAEYLMALTK